MASAVKLVQPLVGKLCTRNVPKIVTSDMIRRFAHKREKVYWNKDWIPGDYPKTQEERDAAAKKYGMISADYEPYPEEEGYGDYPKLPVVSYDGKSDYYNWDFPEHKRDWCEPIHPEYDMHDGGRHNANYIYPYSMNTQFCWFLGIVGFNIFMFLITEPYPYFLPCKKKQYPFDDEKVHYSFEIEQD